MKHNDTVITFYTDNEDGSFDELTVDIYNRNYDYVSGCKKEHLNIYNIFRVERDLFCAYHDIVENLYSGSYLSAGFILDNKEREAKERKKPLITKDKIWQAINWELSENELDRIISFDYRYENDDYYDFNLIMDKTHALMKGERSISYYNSWCILLMRCFMNYMKCRSKRLSRLYYDLGDYFDGVAFMSLSLEGEEKLKYCRETIAELKYFNHMICNLKNKATTDFTTNGVITYVSFCFSLSDGTECLYRVCVVDKEKETINYMYVPEFDYSEGINYTFLSDAEFDDLSSKYFDYYALDTSLTHEYALLKTKN